MARLSTLACTSVGGTRPVRTAATNSASEPASCSGPVPGTAGTGTPSVVCATGSWSPSQTAVPSVPLTRQAPFHEVSRPELHQLPVKPNRVPSANAATTWAAASPANQLHGGLNDSQLIHTGSPP